jgi:hypothetical protein
MSNDAWFMFKDHQRASIYLLVANDFVLASSLCYRLYDRTVYDPVKCGTANKDVANHKETVMLLFGHSSVRLDPARVAHSWRPSLHRLLSLWHLRAARPCSRDGSRPHPLEPRAPTRATDLALPGLRRCPRPYSCLPLRLRSIHLQRPLSRSVPLTSSTPTSSSASTSLHFLSKQQVDLAPESACCKRLFQMFQRYVASVSYGCCKSRSRFVNVACFCSQ